MKALFALAMALSLAGCGHETGQQAPAPTAAPSRTPPPSPAPTGLVSDAELIALLADRLGEDPAALSLDREWKITAGFPDEHQTVIPEAQWICADSGAKPGPRYIALCTRLAGAALDEPGDIGLWRVQPASADAPVREDLFTDGIDSGHWGEPGDVALVEIGPGRPAFVLQRSGTGFGRVIGGRGAVYAPGDEGFSQWLEFDTRRSNPGACDPADPACADQLYAFECALRFGRTADAAGYYPLTLEIRGTQGHRRIERDLALARTGDGYAPPRDSECDPP